jgi:hypothetical protein
MLSRYVFCSLIALMGYAPVPIDTPPATPSCPVTAPNRHAAPVRSDPIPGSDSLWHGNPSVGTFLSQTIPAQLLDLCDPGLLAGYSDGRRRDARVRDRSHQDRRAK